jgi:hypothetical protein
MQKRDAKIFFKKWFSDAFGVGRSDGVSSFRGDGDVIRPSYGFDGVRVRTFLENKNDIGSERRAPLST